VTARRVRIRADSYVDSVRLMSARRAMLDVDGITQAAAVMGTEANRGSLADDGFEDADLGGTGANDLVLAVEAEDEEAADAALDAAESSLAGTDGDGHAVSPGERPPRTVEQAVSRLDGANLAIVSVAAEYAVLEAHRALTAGLHVLLFSSGIAATDEIALKQRARELGLLVMGPDAGTAMLAGVGLGFANVVRPGPVGVLAAAGTGAQEVMTLLHRWGSGPSQVIGIGGRDVTADVDGAMARAALTALRSDPATTALLLVSKPPARAVADDLVSRLAGVPAVAAFVGLEPSGGSSGPSGEGHGGKRDVRLAATLEQSVLAMLELLGHDAPDPAGGLADVAASAADSLSGRRRALRGLFSGGTLCYEAMVLASRRLGRVHSNTPLRGEDGLPAPDGAHICLDLGAPEYTEGRPHPMIDPEPRADAIREQGRDPTTAVVLLDVVLGHVAHDDPAGVLAPACADVRSQASPPAVVVYVLGTEDDPQDAAAQRTRFAEAGCLLAPTNARAALLATAIAARRPEVATEPV
jgi:FdrA protein